MMPKLMIEDFIKDMHNLYIHLGVSKIYYTIKDKIDSRECKRFCEKI